MSIIQFQVSTNGGAVCSTGVLLKQNAGFQSVRSSPVRQNLSGLDAFVVRLGGDKRRYNCTVQTQTGFETPIYQCAFETKRSEWEEHRLPFKDFIPTFRGRVLTSVPPLDPPRITSVGCLISHQQNGSFQLEVERIKASADTGK